MDSKKDIPNYGDKLPTIVHSGDYDLILSPDSRLSAQVKTLSELFKDGIPSNWQPYSVGENKNLFVDKDEPEYIAKNKTSAGPDIWKKILADPYWSGEKKRFKMSLNSIVNEFVMAGVVKELVASEESQDIVKRFGFDSISFAEPLIGVINNKTGTKTIVYGFKKGYASPDTNIPEGHPVNEMRKPEALDLAFQLGSFFGRNNVRARDLFPHHLMVNIDEKGKHLYLIDIEGYYRV